jgi:two-component system LytT family response regulator
MRETIGHLSERLDGRHFVRIHRSIIVNVSRIRELEPVNSGEYIVTLKNGKELSCSRGFRNELDRFISKCV